MFAFVLICLAVIPVAASQAPPGLKNIETGSDSCEAFHTCSQDFQNKLSNGLSCSLYKDMLECIDQNTKCPEINTTMRDDLANQINNLCSPACDGFNKCFGEILHEILRPKPDTDYCALGKNLEACVNDNQKCEGNDSSQVKAMTVSIQRVCGR